MLHNVQPCMNEHPSDGSSMQPSADRQDGGSYRAPIQERSFLLNEYEGDAPESPEPDLEALRALVKEIDCEGTTYQSVAVAAVQIMERVLHYEQEAAEAALSLGQQEKLKSMVGTLERAVSTLRGTLNAQGHKVMHLCGKQAQSAPSPAVSAQQPWWFVLTDALEVLEEGTDQMTSLTTGQPTGSPARELSQLVAQLLRGHHDALLIEAEEWIS